MHLYPVSPSEMTPPSPPLDRFPKIHLNLGAQASLMVKTEEGDKDKERWYFIMLANQPYQDLNHQLVLLAEFAALLPELCQMFVVKLILLLSIVNHHQIEIDPDLQ